MVRGALRDPRVCAVYGRATGGDRHGYAHTSDAVHLEAPERVTEEIVRGNERRAGL